MPSSGISLTDRDRRILAFVADHQFVLERQAAGLVHSSVQAIRGRLRQLELTGHLRRVKVFDEFCCVIRPAGLRAIGSDLPVPELRLASYKHDVGAAWLWLAAQEGAFGPVAEVLAERRVRSHDEAAVAPEEPYGVRLGGYRADGREHRHYPDVLLVDPHGRRMALELELSPKGASRRETILAGYGADRRLDGVIYLVEDNSQGRPIGRAVDSSAATMRLGDRIHVRRISPIQAPAAAPAGRPAARRVASRSAAVEAER